MRPQRNKQFDWSKPFKLVSSQREFEQIQTGQQITLPPTGKQGDHAPTNYKKQNIITPKIQNLPRITQIKQFAKITPNYIRLSARLNLPKLIDYELTEVDHLFIKTHSEKYKFKGKSILTEQFLSKAFIQMQTKAGKDPVIPRNKGWMIKFLQKCYKDLLEWEMFQNFASLVYNFWKNHREDVKFPLLRSLWRPTPEEFNHLLAFKPRQKQKRNLRKTTRISEDQIFSELHEQFQIAKQITQRIQLREQLRLKHLQTQFAIFHNQCKGLFRVPEFMCEMNTYLTPDTRIKDKQRVKQSHQRLDRLKVKRDEPYEANVDLALSTYQNQINQSIPQQIYDQKLSIACFLSTVLCQVQAFGINYMSILDSKAETAQVIEIIPPVLKEEIPLKSQPGINVNLYLQGDLIIRDFDQISFTDSQYSAIEQDNSTSSIHKNLNKKVHDHIYPRQCNKKSIKFTQITQPYIQKPRIKRCHDDILAYFSSKVSQFYIGEDDQFQGKDLRKNISGSFKKFQYQIRQI